MAGGTCDSPRTSMVLLALLEMSYLVVREIIPTAQVQDWFPSSCKEGENEWVAWETAWSWRPTHPVILSMPDEELPASKCVANTAFLAPQDWLPWPTMPSLWAGRGSLITGFLWARWCPPSQGQLQLACTTTTRLGTAWSQASLAHLDPEQCQRGNHNQNKTQMSWKCLYNKGCFPTPEL